MDSVNNDNKKNRFCFVCFDGLWGMGRVGESKEDLAGCHVHFVCTYMNFRKGNLKYQNVKYTTAR